MEASCRTEFTDHYVCMHITFRRNHPSIRKPKTLEILTNETHEYQLLNSIAVCHSMMPSVDNGDAAPLHLWLFTSFRINAAFINACYFHTSSHSSKVNYLSNGLAPDIGANKVGKVL